MKKNKIITLIILLIIVFTSLYLVLQNFFVPTKNITHELGYALSSDINTYLKSVNGKTEKYKIDTSKVNIDEAGTYKYTIKYLIFAKKGKITLVDTEVPKITYSNTILKTNSTSLMPLIKTCKDASKECIISFKNKSDVDLLKTAGTYTIPVIISDKYNNKYDDTVSVKVVNEDDIKTLSEYDLEPYTIPKTLVDFNNTYLISLDKGVPLADIKKTFTNTTESKKLAVKYIKNNYKGYKIADLYTHILTNQYRYAVKMVLCAVLEKDGTQKYVYFNNEMLETVK